MTQHSKKLKVSLISALLVLGLATSPVRADDSNRRGNVLAPLAAFLVLGSLLRQEHGYRQRSSQRRHGNYGHGRHGNYGHRDKRRVRSHSYEGYKRKSRRNYQH